MNRLRIYLNSSYGEQVSELISKDLAVADDLNQMHNLEKLILYQRWLMELVNNFVSFSNLYNPKRSSFFEMGTFALNEKETVDSSFYLTFRIWFNACPGYIFWIGVLIAY